jgi:hypothetical protein
MLIMDINTGLPQLHLQSARHRLVDKIEWVETYLKEVEPHVDVLNERFVNAYINKFSVKHTITMFGALKCNDLGKTLKVGYDKSLFNRVRIGLHEHMSGFPNWVYVYSLKLD